MACFVPGPSWTCKKASGETWHFKPSAQKLPSSYGNVDYALAQALREAADLPCIGLTYDIACQYLINLRKRFDAKFPHYAPLVPRILGLVPKMHLVGHKDDCRYRFSLNYTPGVGHTAGELIETVWHELNQANGSAKEMNPGHRHNFLDDMYGDWNWKKIQNMCETVG
ncbi:hypothetical protein K439DRAFT_1352311 [Ramaria rubella]|nr:hypothetical protein K439DRAFT_1352311 [Ramaria rubella]